MVWRFARHLLIDYIYRHGSPPGLTVTISPGGLPRLAPSKEHLLPTDNLLNQLTSSIDLSKSKVVRSPAFIFLCGGPVPTNDETKEFMSCRDIFFNFILCNNYSFSGQIILAEEIFTYFDHSSYDDLLTFEEDLADLSSLTIIFSESPGSIAEFGSFAVLDSIRDKLLVVLHENDSHKESFIWRGPASHLIEWAKKNNKENPITIYNWKTSNLTSRYMNQEHFDDAEDLADMVNGLIKSRPKTMSFHTSRQGHVMLLLVALLDIMHLATLDELFTSLKNLSINIEKKTLERYVSLLVSLELIVRKPYRNYVFYLSAPSKPWISLSFASDAKNRDAMRWKSLFLEDYRNVSIQKSRALKSYLKSKGHIG